MAPKSSNVYVIMQDGEPVAAFADEAQANTFAEENDASVRKVELTEKAPAAKSAAPKAAPKAKSSKAAAADDSELSELALKIQELLSGSGDSLAGMTVVVTGVPTDPKVNRKDIDALVTKYGGKLTKSLSKNTSFVVVGKDAGPTKMDKIEELGLETLDHGEFVERIGSGGGGMKRASAGEEKPSKKKRKA